MHAETVGESSAEAAPPVIVRTGVIERVLFARPRDGFGILRPRSREQKEPLVLIGDLAGIEEGESVRVEGFLEQDGTWGRRLRVLAVEPLVPGDGEAVAAFLASGVVKGLGRRLARRLRDHFGEQLPRILDREPTRLREVRGVGVRLAARIARVWRERALERDLLVFLHREGFGPRRARAVLEAFGPGGRERIEQDPYSLVRSVRGIGFDTADRLARRLGHDEESPLRLRAVLEEALRRAADEGHSALPQSELIDAARRLAALPDTAYREALRQAVSEGHLRLRRLRDEPFLLLPELDRAEADIAADLARLAGGPLPWKDIDPPPCHGDARTSGLRLSPAQREALDRLLRHKLAILTGGPGTGKTTLVRALLRSIDGTGLEVALAAPTGRAARRLAESTGAPASTLHRLLEAEPGRGFRRDRRRPLRLDLLVVDEASMIDLTLMHATLAALPDRAALLLVGDADQLPSVGPGQVLADLIASHSLPVVRLEEIFRQAAESGIVQSAHRLLAGEMPVFSRDSARGDCFGVRIASPEEARERLVELVCRRIPDHFGLDPLTDIQVLCPGHRGPLGTRELNRILQTRLNPAPASFLERGDLRFGLGDKLMQTENDAGRDIYNGDIGIVTAVDRRNRSLTLRVEGRDIICSGEQIEALVPAYAVTVHKAQGSEYPAVVLLLANQHGRMLRRRLVYTAITRARRLLVILCEPAALERAIRSPEPPRTSLLRYRILGDVT